MQISSRKVLQQVLQSNGAADDVFGAVCVIVDKLDKIGEDKVGRPGGAASEVPLARSAALLALARRPEGGAGRAARWRRSCASWVSASRPSPPSSRWWRFRTWTTCPPCWVATVRWRSALCYAEHSACTLQAALSGLSYLLPDRACACRNDARQLA